MNCKRNEKSDSVLTSGSTVGNRGGHPDLPLADIRNHGNCNGGHDFAVAALWRKSGRSD